ncbi:MULTISPECIES: hypothetical protein [unclassified Streptomyces]|uniref:hypothetical protein n=1 Tax=unclassified Streptomyces TaxID=2593676 RepID=UPI000DAB9404|nr:MULTISPECIES: hypothetical protein [unclassified Streptomyces]PZT75529.1 hypothetical protein DNK56_18820 [Streptomyces sp. AC1-42W]WUC94333.1 hypothetical protein OG710_12340 [Streptomyces sp. NBC_00525]
MNRRSAVGLALSVAGLGVLVALAAVATALELDGSSRIVVTAVIVFAIAGASALVGAAAVRGNRGQEQP